MLDYIKTVIQRHKDEKDAREWLQKLNYEEYKKNQPVCSNCKYGECVGSMNDTTWCKVYFDFKIYTVPKCKYFKQRRIK